MSTDALVDRILNFYQEHYIFLKDEISKQMKKYTICTEDLNEIEHHLNTTDYNENRFDFIAPNTQNIELQDQAEGTEDLHPDLNENYDLSDDHGIPSASFNSEPLILNELPDDDCRQMIQTLNIKSRKHFFYHILHQIKTTDIPFYCFLEELVLANHILQRPYIRQQF